MKKETECDHRLVELAAAWLRQAKELDVYLQYEFTGVTAAPGRDRESARWNWRPW